MRPQTTTIQSCNEATWYRNAMACVPFTRGLASRHSSTGAALQHPSLTDPTRILPVIGNDTGSMQLQQACKEYIRLCKGTHSKLQAGSYTLCCDGILCDTHVHSAVCRHAQQIRKIADVLGCGPNAPPAEAKKPVKSCVHRYCVRHRLVVISSYSCPRRFRLASDPLGLHI